MKKSEDIISKMTLEEKCSYYLGNRYWQFKKIGDYPLITLTDGPNGIRRISPITEIEGDTLPATSFPNACLTACSFDRDLLKLEGKMIAKEAIRKKVDIVLGPGINIKRSPLCGRNFEYFSEDPFLASELGISYINGVQEEGVGTSLKHFAANSQESFRLVNDSIVDERALHEIYLKGFERCVKKASPSTIMVSYNKLNGIHTCENEELITNILRMKWGFKGLIISDWGAVFDPVESFKAGLDVEMPGTAIGNDVLVKEYLSSHPEEVYKLDEFLNRYLEIHKKYAKEKVNTFDKEESFITSRKIASESMVLLKNEGLLPLKEDDKIALIGAFADKPRYQGGGSSNVIPSYNDTFLQIMKENMIDFTYAEGYSLLNEKEDDFLEETAIKALTNKDKVVFFMGLPPYKESEGFDRDDMFIPRNQLSLLNKILEINRNVVVVLQVGSPVELPFANNVKSILLSYLTGEMNGSSIYDVLFNKVNPSGRLAETFPLKLEDNPSYPYYLKNDYFSEYRESIFVGYRYYSTFNLPVRYPFGHGLSYTSFEYSEPSIKEEKDKVIISLKVKNTGSYEGKEVVQVYVNKDKSNVLRPKKELKGFDKVLLLPNEEKVVKIVIEKEDLKYYSVTKHDFILEEGEYNFFIAKNCNDESMKLCLNIEGEKVIEPSYPSIYSSFNRPVSKEEFELVYGKKINTSHKIKPYTMDTTIGELRKSFLGSIVFGIAEKEVKKHASEEMRDMIVGSYNMTPIRSSSMAGFELTRENVEGILDIFSWHVFRGLKKLLKKDSKSKKEKKNANKK